MRRRRTADEITRLLKEADRDLAKGLTVSDICRKHGISQSIYYRWRDKRDPAKVDADRRHRSDAPGSSSRRGQRCRLCNISTVGRAIMRESTAGNEATYPGGCGGRSAAQRCWT